MIRFIKKTLFKTLSLENYLRFLQRSYFLLYNTGYLKSNPIYDYHYYVRNLIKKGDIVLDIGANLGYYSMLFAKWTGSQGHVYAVEPVAAYNRIFNEAARKYGNITLYPYALGLEEKPIEMVTSPRTGYLNTGLPHVYDAGKDGKIEEQEFRFEAQMKIPSQLFGTLERIDYIKCDIEGFEYTVLAEMRDIIDRCKPKIQVEVWGEHEKKVTALLKEMGYMPHKLFGGKLIDESVPAFGTIDEDYIFIHRNDKSYPA